MPLEYPDILTRANDSLPIVDSEDVKGADRAVATLAEMYALSSQIGKLTLNVTKVYVTTTGDTYLLRDLAQITSSAGWELIPFLDEAQVQTIADAAFQAGLPEIADMIAAALALGAVPRKVPSTTLGAPSEPKLYFATPDTYSLYAGEDIETVTVEAPLTIFLWDGTTWDYIEIPIEVDLSGVRLKSELIKTSDTDFFVRGKNLFNKDSQDNLMGYFLLDDGTQVANGSFFISHEIDVNQNTQYSFLNFDTGGAYNVYLNEAHEVIGGFQTNPTTTPTGTKYVKMSGVISKLATQQFELGATNTAYEDYKESLNPSNLTVPVTNTIARANTTTAVTGNAVLQALAYKLDKTVGKNKFNPNDPEIIVEKFIQDTGEYITNSAFNITAPIPIGTGQTLRANYSSGGFRHALYNEKNQIIYISASGVSSLTHQTGAVYARFTYSVSEPNVQIELGSTITGYTPYEVSIPNLKLIVRNIVEALNNTIPVTGFAVDRSLGDKLDKTVGKNKFNPNDSGIIANAYIQDGVLYTNANPDFHLSVTGYIPISSGQTLKGNFSLGGDVDAALFDVNGNIMPSTSVNSNSITHQTGAVYARFTYQNTFVNMQIEIGSVSTVYEKYTSSTVIDKKLDVVVGKNKYNVNDPDVIENAYINDIGQIVTGLPPDYNIDVSGFIPIANGQTLKANYAKGNTYQALYDNNKNYISGSATDEVSITGTSASAYARFSTTGTNPVQIETGTISTVYAPYTTLGFLESLTPFVPDYPIESVLPNKLYFAKNKPLSFYHENIIFKGIDDPTKPHFSLGTNYTRQTVFGFTEAQGETTLNLELARNLKKVEQKSYKFEVVDGANNSGKTVVWLAVGDSFTDIRDYISELKNQLTADGANVTLIGTTGTQAIRAEGLSGGTLANTFLNASSGSARLVTTTDLTLRPDTGFPGAEYKDTNNNVFLVRGTGNVVGGVSKVIVTRFGAVDSDFATFPPSGTLTKVQPEREGQDVITYSGAIAGYFNPFINPSTGNLDITNYISYYGFAAPTLVSFQFTWNDLPDWANVAQITELVANFKLAVDHVHSAFPLAKIILSVEPFGAYGGNSTNINQNGKKYSVLMFVKALLAMFEQNTTYDAFVKIAPSYAGVDLVNAYSTTSVAPNANRFPTITERSGGDGVHPYGIGMLQIADVMYPIATKLI